MSLPFSSDTERNKKAGKYTMLSISVDISDKFCSVPLVMAKTQNIYVISCGYLQSKALSLYSLPSTATRMVLAPDTGILWYKRGMFQVICIVKIPQLRSCSTGSRAQSVLFIC